MGLDQYLHKNEYVNQYDFSQEPYSPVKKSNIVIETEYEDGHKKTVAIENIKGDGGIYIKTPFAYWRKANAVHRWFLEKTGQAEDVCQEIRISGEQLLELVEDCRTVLADHSLAEEVLPTQGGFFFGSTEYDEWYFKDLEKTVEMLKDVDPEDEFIYQASW